MAGRWFFCSMYSRWGLPHALLAKLPEMARSVAGLFWLVDQPAPILRGHHLAVRGELEAVEAECVAETAKRFEERSPHIWPGLERSAGKLVGELGAAADPWVARAWLTLARCTRFQKGRRDDTLRAYFNALHLDRVNPDAWLEVFEYVCLPPYIPMLLDLYARVPAPARPAIATYLLNISYGKGGSSLRAYSGPALRAVLESLAVSQNDQAAVAVLAADAGVRAEKERRP
ncbi:hypothetical protein [Spirillospora sp. NPDC029432]|uniref:hypothetical protein n=1 Tax=Spirillospora sp. NPDC029432 TaxID=3154599 RepID=UPI00345731D5